MGLEQDFTTAKQQGIPDLFSHIMHGDVFSIGEKRYKRVTPSSGGKPVLCERQGKKLSRPSDLSANDFLVAISTRTLETETEHHVNGELGKILNGSCFSLVREEGASVFKFYSSLTPPKLQKIYFAEGGSVEGLDDTINITANELIESMTGPDFQFVAAWALPTTKPRPSYSEDRDLKF